MSFVTRARVINIRVQLGEKGRIAFFSFSFLFFKGIIGKLATFKRHISSTFYVQIITLNALLVQ